MSPRNRRAAAAAAIGVLAGGVPVSAAGAVSSQSARPVQASGGSDQGDPNNRTDLIPASQHSNVPPDPGAGSDAGSTPQDGPDANNDPSPSDQSGDAQCGQVTFTNTFPTVITCGPVTITFNTVTTTTTVTTVSAPITAANGPITTTTNNPAPATILRCKPSPSKKAKTTRPKPKRPITKRKGGTRVLKPAHGTRTVKVRLLLGPRPSF